MDEPRRHPVFMILLAAAAIGTVPFAFAGTELKVVWGLRWRRLRLRGAGRGMAREALENLG